MSNFAVPFAKALAVFVRECECPPLSQRRQPHQPLSDDETPTGRDEQLSSWARKVAEENRALEEQGKLDQVEFTSDSPAEAAASRLRLAAQRLGVSQKALAEKLGVTPAVINRVFQKPDRSKVSTLKRIARAMGVQLHEII